jgi:hypothetical protein
MWVRRNAKWSPVIIRVLQRTRRTGVGLHVLNLRRIARAAGDSMSEHDARRLERRIDRISHRLPAGLARFLRWLKGPSSRWVRIPIALLLIVGGLAGFLPILGFWMVPVGAVLLALDVPFLQRPVLRLLTWLEQTWARLKARV